MSKKKSGFGLMLEDMHITAYELSKETDYAINALYRIVNGEQSFWTVGIQNVQNFANFLFNGDLNKLVKTVREYDLTVMSVNSNIRG